MSCPLLNLEQAVECLAQGGIIGYPTEAVFGIGCRIDRTDTLQRLLAIKQRQANKGLIIIGANAEQLIPLVAPAWRRQLAEACPAFWPGTTLVVPAAEGLDPILTGTRQSIALRQVKHALAAELCRLSDSPLVSTSANLSGHAALRQADQVMRELPKLDGVLDGATGGQTNPSRIISWPDGQVLRP